MLVRDGTGYLQISHAMFLVTGRILRKGGVYHGIRRSDGKQELGGTGPEALELHLGSWGL
jgi:hypothetical protein